MKKIPVLCIEKTCIQEHIVMAYEQKEDGTQVPILAHIVVVPDFEFEEE